MKMHISNAMSLINSELSCISVPTKTVLIKLLEEVIFESPNSLYGFSLKDAFTHKYFVPLFKH
jgi:hypothetical protein